MYTELDGSHLSPSQNLYEQDFIRPQIATLVQKSPSPIQHEAIQMMLSVVACSIPVQGASGKIYGRERSYRSSEEILKALEVPYQYSIYISRLPAFRAQRISREMLAQSLRLFPEALQDVVGWAEYIQLSSPGTKGRKNYLLNGEPHPQADEIAIPYEIWVPRFAERMGRKINPSEVGLEEVLPEGYNHQALIPDDGRIPASRIYPQAKAAEVSVKSIFVPKPAKE